MRSAAPFAAGVLLVTAVGVLACATTGARSKEATADTASAPAQAASTQAAPAPPPVPTPAPTPAASAASAPPGSSPAAAYLADPQAMTRASQLFRAVCTGYCHSTQAAADRVAPNLFDCQWAHGSSDEEIFHTISAGVPDTQMQGFGERLPHEDLWKLVAYIRSKSTCK